MIGPIVPVVFFCGSASIRGELGVISAGLACGIVFGCGGAPASWALAVTTRGRTALLSCALISTAAKRTATANRARRALIFIAFQKELNGLKLLRAGGRSVGLDSPMPPGVVNLFLRNLS